jgi:hypothetical protein
LREGGHGARLSQARPPAVRDSPAS